MDNPPPSSQENDDKIRALRALIAQRKRFDAMFNMIGMGLIVMSLSVLAALGLKLIYDGGSRLVETFEITPWGMAPGSRDVVGEFGKSDAAGALAAGYQVTPDAVVLHTSDKSDVAKMIGQRVALTGDIERDGTVEVETIRIIPQTPPGEKIDGDPVLVGKITGIRQKAGDEHHITSDFQPEPMRVIVAEKPEKSLDDLVGQRVAVDAGRRGRKADLGLIEAREVIPLKTQNFLTGMLSTNPRESGMFPALIGTLLVVIVTGLLTIPMGVAAGIYLEEYAPKNWFTNLIEINIANLAGVPSVIWGLLGLGLFVISLGLGESVGTAGLTLGLLVLPIIIIATREAIRSIPNTIREASIGLGATKWQTVRYHVLPYSTGGILTGAIIAMSRAVGETAPLVLVGAAISINFTPFDDPAMATQMTANPINWLKSQFTVMPMITYHWVGQPEHEFHRLAAAGSIVLVTFTLAMNAVAIYLRYRLRRNIKW